MAVIEGLLAKYWQTAVVFGLDINDEGVEAIWSGGTGLNAHREGLVRRAFGNVFPKEADHEDKDLD
jgi:hypothetical protein